MGGLEKLRVLLVDDNQHMRAIVSAVLVGVGVRDVREASDGGEALTILRDWPADVAIVDFQMVPWTVFILLGWAELLERRVRGVDRAHATVPWHRPRRTFHLDDDAGKRGVWVRDPSFACDKISNIPAAQLFHDEPPVTVEVDAVILGLWIAINDQPAGDRDLDITHAVNR
jgi:hypothetical protein